MATVTGLTAERMIAMENATVIDGDVVGNNLILRTRDGTTIDTGNVRGPIGPSGAAHTICTSTTRPVLAPGDEGKSIYETDTDLVRIWTGTRWRVQEKIICTSTTRPTSLGAADEGTKIYETDTNNEYSWNGSSWTPFSQPPIFTSAADRNTKYPNPTDGSVSYLSDAPGILWMYFGGAWHPYGEQVGTLSPTILANPPMDYCFCYGQVLVGANVNYPTLWPLVDPAWKSGNDLKIPDLRGRVAVGKDNMGGVAAQRIGGARSWHGVDGTIMGSAGGGEWLQGHNHGVNDPWHSHWDSGPSGPSGAFGGWFVGNEVNNSATAAAPTGITIQSTGNGSHQNIQPSLILNWQLKLR